MTRTNHHLQNPTRSRRRAHLRRADFAQSYASITELQTGQATGTTSDAEYDLEEPHDDNDPSVTNYDETMARTVSVRFLLPRKASPLLPRRPAAP